MDGPLTNQPVLELMFAIAVPAFGSAILFNMGASSGGTDIVAMILKKYTGYDIGRVLMLSDVAIAVAGVFVFGMETGLFSILGLVLRSVITDNFIESFNLSKCFNVVCSRFAISSSGIFTEEQRSTRRREFSPAKRNILC